MADCIQHLMAIARRWKDPQDLLRRQAIELAAPEFCLSAASFVLGLDWIFEQWTEKNIQLAIIKSAFKNHCQSAVQILAGTTPAMIAQGFFQGAILDITQCIKIPREQTVFATLLFQSFVEQSNHFSELFELIATVNKLTPDQDVDYFYKKLAQADLVIAYGHDDTMETLKTYLKPDTLFIAHGHAESASIIFNDMTNIDAYYHALEKLADDMLSYDQRGCLSPRVTLVESGGKLSPSGCATLFAEKILPEAIKKWPRGGLFAGEAAEILHQRNLYGFRGSVYTGENWTVCYDEQPFWPSVSLPRFMPFKPLEKIDFINNKHINAGNASALPNLISIGYAGSDKKMAELCKDLDSDVRVCKLGEMQRQLLVF